MDIIAKHTTKKKLLLCAQLVILSVAFALESGPHLVLGGTFGGSITQPQLTPQVLADLNPLATAMTGTMSKMLAGGSIDIGYIFMSDKFLFLPRNSVFSGFGVFGNIGIGQASTGQKITAAVQGTGKPFDIFMTVDFLPTIDAGVTAKAYFWERLGLGVNFGTRVPADLAPQYLLYTSLPEAEAQAIGLEKQVGTIIVTDDMMKKMNPFMVTLKGIVDYSIPLSPVIELILGAYAQYTWFRPMYLTMPTGLKAMAANPDKAQPDYWLNSLNFGFSLAFSFRLKNSNSVAVRSIDTIRRGYASGGQL